MKITENKCENCKHWRPFEYFGECERLYGSDGSAPEDHEGQTDEATFYCGPNFGCNLFENKM